MDEERLTEEKRGAIVAYFEGWELVELLEVPIDIIIDALEDYVMDSLGAIEEYMGIDDNGSSEEQDED